MIQQAKNDAAQLQAIPGSRRVLSVRDVLFGYPGLSVGQTRTVVAQVHELNVNGGMVCTLVGASGVGKSTLLATIAGSLPPLEGTISIDGQSMSESARLRQVARTLQSFPLFHWLTVEGNLRLAASIKDIQAIRVDEVLSQFHAEHLASRMPKTLSGGERCRASLAQAFLSQPKVILLDEPFTGLDLMVKESIAESIFSVARLRGTAVLFVTHDLHDACEYADRVVVLTGAPTACITGMVELPSSGALAEIRSLLREGATR